MENSIYPKLVNSLQTLGLKKGSIVLLKGDLTEIGMIASNPKSSLEAVFTALWDSIGGEENGTIITSSFTDATFKFNKTDFVFERTSQSKGGGSFTKYFLKHPRAVRSTHPTNSFIAIGKYAVQLLEDHTERSRPYDPVGKVIEMGGIAISLGSVGGPPDFMTGHYAQQQLGRTKGSILSLMTEIKYKKGDTIHTYRVKEVGGCSRGHHKVYAKYVLSKKLKVAYFGNAYSIGMLASDAFNISMEMQRKNPRSFLCDDPNCFSCRGTWFWNMRDWPLFYLRNIFSLAKKMRAND